MILDPDSDRMLDYLEHQIILYLELSILVWSLLNL